MISCAAGGLIATGQIPPWLRTSNGGSFNQNAGQTSPGVTSTILDFLWINTRPKSATFLSLILRHKPQVIGLHLDANGWAQVDELIELVNQHGIALRQKCWMLLLASNEQSAAFTFNCRSHPDIGLIRAIR